MKLSLAWIFDHIRGSWQEQDVAYIVSRFNQVTAEIEHFYEVSFPLDQFFLAQRAQGSFDVTISELGVKVALPARLAEPLAEGGESQNFLVKRVGSDFMWATLADFGVERDGLVPAVHARPDQLAGAWREVFASRDVILDVDNKSITHRPDMWGHRGFAREIAAILGLPLRAASDFLKEYPVVHAEVKTGTAIETNIGVENRAPEICHVFNGLHVLAIKNQACDLAMLSRLMMVGARPINALVDITNYITLDWAQPVHAYDAEKIKGDVVMIRHAQEQEQLVLLDGSELSLTQADLVIADVEEAMCLAGVKGGLYSGVTATTESVFFEAANFAPGGVRRSALRHKTRTDSSARFEKTLDQNQALEAVKRFLCLLDRLGIQYTLAPAIISIGKRAPGLTLTVKHSFLTERSGLALQPDIVVDLLGRIECHALYDQAQGEYQVSVPTFRSSKDITSPEDILEEVMRLVGFEKIPLVLPPVARRPFDLSGLFRQRAVKRYLVDVAGMTETQNYAFFDEQALQQIGLDLPAFASLVNPVSENYVRLVSSLVPGLLKNLKENHVLRDGMRLFEVGRVWQGSSATINERKAVAAIWYEKRKPVSFYQMKAWFWALLESLGFDVGQLQVIKVEQPEHSWYKPYQTARILYDGVEFGILGQANPLLLARLDIIDGADAVIAELDLDAIYAYKLPQKQFVPFSRFQETFLDVSVMVPVALTAQHCLDSLRGISPLVFRVELIDFFEKESWDNERSLTMRLWLIDPEKNLEKAVIDEVLQRAVEVLKNIGAQLRS